jgi:hypothetical protein
MSYHLRDGDALPANVDRFGWLCDESSCQNGEHDTGKSAAERRREVKWRAMMGPIDPSNGLGTNSLEIYYRSQRKTFKRRVLKGIPDACRSRAWLLLVDPCFEASTSVRPSVDHLFTRGVPDADMAIQGDIPHAMPGVALFATNSGRDSLYRVLRAYANLDPDVGYFQEMAFHAALFLCYMTEQRAFWALNYLMSGKHQLREFFLNDFDRLKGATEVWDIVLRQNFPDVHGNLRALCIDHITYTRQWFLSAFQAFQFNPNLRLRIYDRYLAFRTRALFSFGLAIVSIERKELMINQMELVLSILQKIDQRPAFKDWSKVLSVYDDVFMSAAQYRSYFEKAGVMAFR